MIALQSNTSKILLTSVILSLGVYIGIEIFQQFKFQTSTEQQATAQEYLDEATIAFSAFYNTFRDQSTSLTVGVQESIVATNDHKAVFDKVINYDFWGITLFKNNTPHVWSGFADKEIPLGKLETIDHPIYAITQKANTTLLTYQNTIYRNEEDSITYTLVATSLLEDEQLLPFAQSKSQSIKDILQIDRSNPISINFIGDIDDHVSFIEPLIILERDTVGYAYIPNTISGSIENQNIRSSASQWILLILLLNITLFLYFSINVRNAAVLLVLRIILLIGFYFTVNLLVQTLSYELATSLEIHIQIVGILLKLILYSFILFLLNHGIYKYLNTLVVDASNIAILLGCNLIYGAIFTLSSYWIFETTHQILQFNDIELYNLAILANTSTLLFYVLSSLVLISIAALFRTLFNFSFKQETKINFQLASVVWGGVFIALVSIFISDSNWLVAVRCMLSLVLVLLVHLRAYMKVTEGWSYTSITRPRLLIIGCFTITTFYHVIGVIANEYKLEEVLKSRAHIFTETIDITDVTIIDKLLRNSSSYLSTLSEQDIQNRTALVQTKLNESIPFIIEPAWHEYSIDLRIVDNNGSEIASYASDLETPNWTRVFGMSSLEIPYQQEQISRATNRPIIRQRPDNDLPDKYSSFQRGWIPIFSPKNNSEEKIAWILCIIYKAPSKFEKPLRSILSAGANDNSNTILVSSYINGLLDKSTFYGKPNTFEDPERIDTTIVPISETQNPIILDRSSGELLSKELYLSLNDSTLIKASTQAPTFENYVFAFTRFFISIFLFGFIVTAIFSLLGIHSLGVFGHTTRFQYRLLDRVTYAIILCLVGLIITTSFAVENQNEELIRNNLGNELDNLADALQIESQFSEDAPSLERATFSLDVDATLYNNGKVIESTVSQIYRQNLLPEFLPWYIYNDLLSGNQEQIIKSTTFVDEPLLIGYKVINESNDIIAIPTFISSPKYSQQVLTSNSYLLGFYILIFGLFTIAAAIIARTLTKPLNNIKGALKTIGEGNLETMLDVKSSDEIGSLTSAYNEMVSKLKRLQEDLAQAEREAAWKEMAQQVAHEIKNPLTPMKLSLQHLERQIQTTETSLESLQPNVQRIARNMIEQIEALDKIASDFSKFAKPMELPFNKLNLNTLIVQVGELHQYHDDIHVHVSVPNEPIYVQAVEDELRGVLVNIIKNAIEAIEKEGSITITLSSKQSKAIIEIQDDGIGISEQDKNRIFVPNFSTKSSGTGLGLAISKKVVEAHNGQIDYTSSLNQGSTFIIRLPKSQ